MGGTLRLSWLGCSTEFIIGLVEMLFPLDGEAGGSGVQYCSLVVGVSARSSCFEAVTGSEITPTDMRPVTEFICSVKLISVFMQAPPSTRELAGNSSALSWS